MLYFCHIYGKWICGHTLCHECMHYERWCSMFNIDIWSTYAWLKIKTRTKLNICWYIIAKTIGESCPVCLMSYNICLLRQSKVCNMFHRKLYWLSQDHRKLTLNLVIVLYTNYMNDIFSLRCFSLTNRVTLRASWWVLSLERCGLILADTR